MSTGLIALLDDVAGIAKVAASSLDDVTAQATRAGVKAAGVVIDDAAVTPRYVVGFAADRELPIVGRIAMGSLKNKLLFLLPAALLLSFFAPWAITPLLMLGGAYLCYEGAEKVYEALWPHAAEHHGAAAAALDARQIEDQKVRGAIQTDFILSAEIMVIALNEVADEPLLNRTLILAVVGVAITVLVYGVVGLIVKMDDIGLHLTERRDAASRALGRGLVLGMPKLMAALSLIGIAAMIWVGGGIIVHGLEAFHVSEPGHLIHELGEAAAHAVPALSGMIRWTVEAAGAGLVGLALGAVIVAVHKRVARH